MNYSSKHIGWFKHFRFVFESITLSNIAPSRFAPSRFAPERSELIIVENDKSEFLNDTLVKSESVICEWLKLITLKLLSLKFTVSNVEYSNLTDLVFLIRSNGSVSAGALNQKSSSFYVYHIENIVVLKSKSVNDE